MFSTIAKMNKQGVKIEQFTPFEWLREQENLEKKLKAEQMMTASDRKRVI